MVAGNRAPLIVVAAGGTGGHLFPAEALASVLQTRSKDVALVTDSRATRYGDHFPAATIHLIPSATLRARHPIAVAQTATMLGLGLAKAWVLLGQLRPAAVIGFGGYPTVPPVMAATLRGIPTIIHEQNGVMGRANRLLAARVTAIATSFPAVLGPNHRWTPKVHQTGNPVRPAVVAAAKIPYRPTEPEGPLRLLVFGGSQGAHIMAKIVPPAIAHLDPTLRSRLRVIQQARPEDIEEVRQSYSALGVETEVAPFFSDLPARMASAHLVVSRSGASTVAELAAIGRPAILVPLPHALDQDQLANATALARVGGAIVVIQDAFSPERLADEIIRLAGSDRLAAMAKAAATMGTTDAADRLADLVLSTAGLSR